MPISGLNYSRPWAFVDHRASGDPVTRADLDAQLNDMADAVNVALGSGLRPIGSWSAATGGFPSLRPDGGAIKARDTFSTTAAGTVDGIAFAEGDLLVALVDGGGETYVNRWLRLKFATLAAIQALADAINADKVATEEARDAAGDHADDAAESAQEAKNAAANLVGWSENFGRLPGQTTIELTNEQASLGQGRIFVFIGGVFQNPGEAWTLVGNTIVFDEALPNDPVYVSGVTNTDATLDDLTALVELAQTYADQAAASAMGWVYATRALMLAATIPAGVLRIGCRVGVFPAAEIATIFFVRAPDGAVNIAGATADGAEWVPDWDITPDHYVRNASPGTTDMLSGAYTAALWAKEAAGALTGAHTAPKQRIVFLNGDYYMSETLTLDDTFENVAFESRGARWLTDYDGPHLSIGAAAVFTTGDTAGANAIYNLTVTGFTFINTDNDTDNPAAIRLGRCWDGYITRNTFRNCVGVDLHHCGHIWVNDNTQLIRTRTKAVAAFMRVHGVYDSTSNYCPSAGIHAFGNEVSGNPSSKATLLAMFDILTCDGFYYGGNHAQHYRTFLNIAPTGNDNNSKNNVISEIISLGGNYADSPASGYPQNVIGGKIASDGTDNGQFSGLYRQIRFSDEDFIRGANLATYGLVVSVDDDGGYAAKHGGLGLIVASGQFEQHVTSPLAVNGTSQGKLECKDFRLADALFSQQRSSAAGGFSGGYIQALRTTITGCMMLEETNEPDYIFSIGGADDGVQRSVVAYGNDFSASTYTVNPWLLTNSKTLHFDDDGNRYRTGPGRFLHRKFGVTTVGAIPQAPLVYDVLGTRKAITVKMVASGYSNGVAGTDNVESMLDGVFMFSKTSAGITARKDVAYSSHTNTTGGLLPDVVVMDGTTWSSGMALAAGDVIVTTGDRVYYVYESDGLAGTTEPTGTTTFEDAGVKYTYLGQKNVGQIRAVILGESGSSTQMNWAGTVDLIQSA